MRLQIDPDCVLHKVIKPSDSFDFTMCNPPFFDSMEERNSSKPVSHCPLEEVTSGGEISFLMRYAMESADFQKQITWFTTMTGKKSTALFLRTYLKEMLPFKVIIVLDTLGLSSKTQRWLVAWKFL